MGLLRMHSRNAIHFVTNRCFQERFFLLPSETVNKIIGYWFARSLARYGQGLEVFAFIFLSNHFHFLIKDTSGNLARFMGYFQGNVAKAINEHIGRRGDFWAREYDDVIVDGESEEDFLDRYVYIVCNSIKAGLTDTAQEWQGCSSLRAALTGERLLFTGINRTKKHLLTRRNDHVDPSKYTETYVIEVATPPMYAHLGTDERAERLGELIKAGEAKFRAAREHKPALGVGAIKKQKWSDRSKNPSFRPRKKVFASNQVRRKELLEGYRSFVSTYRETYDGFRKAMAKGTRPRTQWPPWSFPPSTSSPVFPEFLSEAA